MLEGVFGGLREWRSSHPKARFAEIEQVVEERRLGEAWARLAEDLAARHSDEPERASCPRCGSRWSPMAGGPPGDGGREPARAAETELCYLPRVRRGAFFPL